MRGLFFLVALLLGIAGFVMPGLWWGAALFAVIAIGMAPPGKRVDGKARTGGLLGGVWDSIAAPAKKCPFCMQQIPRAATRCPKCAGDLSEA